MFATGALKRCQARKLALVEASNANRQALKAELGKVRPIITSASRWLGYARMAERLWTTLSPVWTAWRSRPPARPGFSAKFHKITALAQSFLSLWNVAQSSKSKNER